MPFLFFSPERAQLSNGNITCRPFGLVGGPRTIDIETAEIEEKCPIEEKANALAIPELAAVTCYRDFTDVKRAAPRLMSANYLLQP